MGLYGFVAGLKEVLAALESWRINRIQWIRMVREVGWAGGADRVGDGAALDIYGGGAAAGRGGEEDGQRG